MKKIAIILFILISSYSTVFNQIIKGTILDKLTKSPIDYAIVYFNGTFVGTNTDKNGYFELDATKYLSMPLSISAIGYQSVTLTDLIFNRPIPIYLTPKVFELQEVVVTSKRNRMRKTYLELFNKEFFGTTLNASSCRITNEKDILFSYDSESETLRASSSKPILIDNKRLGYKIDYYLDKFEFCKKNTLVVIIGNYIFKEELGADSIQQKKFENRRRTAFLGSRMQFFRALWENNLDELGFTIRDSLNRKVPYQKIVVLPEPGVDRGQIKFLTYKGILSLSYYTKWAESLIVMTKDSVSFDKRGFFDPLGIRWEGEMAKQRIADLLPFEYSMSLNNR
jgi:hypothetical protein